MAEESEAGQLPRWRLWVAMGVLVVLAVLVAMVAQRSGSDTDESTASPETTTTPTEPSDDTVPDDILSDDPLLDDVAASLDAWARFASSGDPAFLDGTFAVDGPQYAQLIDEVGALTGTEDGEHQFDIVGAETTAQDADTATVAATVGFTRPDGDRFEYDWDIEMRHPDPSGPWLLWTVSTRR